MFFFFSDPVPTVIYTLSLHDALPISPGRPFGGQPGAPGRDRGPADGVRGGRRVRARRRRDPPGTPSRSEEHTSELQSRLHLVCRLLLEKKKTKTPQTTISQRKSRLTS